jgi:hypothetical protein
LAQALAQNTSLIYLDLDRNCIGDDGAKALADALHVNTSLQTLWIRYNGIGLAGMAALSEAMRWNASITDMELDEDRRSAQLDEHVHQIWQYTEVGADGIYVDYCPLPTPHTTILHFVFEHKQLCFCHFFEVCFFFQVLYFLADVAVHYLDLPICKIDIMFCINITSRLFIVIIYHTRTFVNYSISSSCCYRLSNFLDSYFSIALAESFFCICFQFFST